MKRINVNMHPKDGYFFQVADGTKLRASNWNGVIARVVAYRAINRLPAGSPEVEVHEQACSRNPQLCSQLDQATVAARKAVSIKGRMLGWLNLIRKKRAEEPLTYVSAEEQKRRADICFSCPFNVHPKEGCGSCKKALAAVRRDIIGGRVPDGRISGCNVSGEDIAVAGWLDIVRVNNPELPGHCWRKTNV